MPNFESKFASAPRRPEKKIVVEVDDGVAHARYVGAGSDIPDYVDRAGRGAEASGDVADILAPVEADELSQTAKVMRQELEDKTLYDPVFPPVGDNLKTIKKNTPHKQERDSRGKIRQFLGKL